MPFTGSFDEQRFLADKASGRGISEHLERLLPMLFEIALRILRRRDLADDACQETCMILCRATPRNSENVKGWITTIHYRVCFRLLKTRRNSDGSGRILPDLPGNNVSPQEHLERREEREVLQVCMHGLTENERRALELRLDNNTYAAAAAAMQIPAETYKDILERARRKVLQCVRRCFN